MINKTDEELAMLFQSGDDYALDILLERYKPLANKLTRMYFLIGADQDDLQQEAVIGLYNACRKFEASSGASFATFARKCIIRNIQTAVKQANRKKNQMLNNRIELTSQGALVTNQKQTDSEDDELCLMLPSTALTPDELLIEEEKLSEIKQEIIKTLSQFELSVLKLYLKGENYNSIAVLLNQSPKSIDNALSRIKNKLSYLKK